jgi:hypothetical protein
MSAACHSISINSGGLDIKLPRMDEMQQLEYDTQFPKS